MFTWQTLDSVSSRVCSHRRNFSFEVVLKIPLIILKSIWQIHFRKVKVNDRRM